MVMMIISGVKSRDYQSCCFILLFYFEISIMRRDFYMTGELFCFKTCQIFNFNCEKETSSSPSVSSCRCLCLALSFLEAVIVKLELLTPPPFSSPSPPPPPYLDWSLNPPHLLKAGGAGSSISIVDQTLFFFWNFSFLLEPRWSQSQNQIPTIPRARGGSLAVLD